MKKPYRINWSVFTIIASLCLSILLLISHITDTNHEFFSVQITAIIMLLFISIILMLSIHRNHVKPVQSLLEATTAMRDGNLDTRVQGLPNQIYSELENSFNDMAASLENNQRELQKQIDAATRELRDTLEAVEIQNVKLDIARKRALEMSHEKTAFLANMSHEIRTPMNGLLGFIDLLLRTPLNAEQRDYTSTIRKSASNLLVIVNDILDFSKIESGKLVVESQPFDLREALEDSVDLMAPVAHEKNLELVLLIYSDVPLQLFGDSNRIRQVLLNLIGNAIKFTEEGSVTIRVMLDEDESNNDNTASIRISVTDTGIGLSSSQKKNLFMAFSQLDSSPSKQHGGTGLGLFISKNLVEAMNGQIGVESALGEGASFWFSLQLPVQSKSLSLTEECPVENPASAIIYDEHPLSRLAIRHPLEDWGLTVCEATDIDELLKLGGSGNHHIILAGLNIDPEHIDASKELLHKLSICRLPIIAMVNEIDRDKLNAWCQEGASLCLTKPVRREALHNAVWTALKIPDEESALFIDRRKTPRPTMPNLTGARILLADDNEINRKLISLQLETLGVQVDTVGNGKEAISLANRNDYDLILMDLHMPGMSGDKAASIIRQHGTNNPNTPIIAITANIFKNELESLSHFGINDCLIKPISEYSLWEAIKRWIGRNIGDGPAETVRDVTLSNQHARILKDLLDMLISDLPDQRVHIARAFENQDWKQLRDLSHKLNGSAAYCQANQLQKAAATLEQAAFEGNREAIENAYITCSQEIEHLLGNTL